MKRKIFAITLLTVFIAALFPLSACTYDSGRERTLIVATNNTVNSLNRLDANGGAPGYAYAMIADVVTQLTLITKREGEYLPQMGSVKSDGENKVYDITLSDGYTWHDGVPVTLDDVLYTFVNTYLTENIEKAEMKSDRITITLAKPDNSIEDLFGKTSLMPKHILEGKTKETLADEQSVIGCGAYKFDGINKAAGTITFKKYENFIDADKLFFDKIIFKHYDTPSVLAMALKKGEADIIWNYSAGLSADLTASLENADGVTVLTDYTGKNLKNVLFFNNADPKLTKNVKQAIAYAIDYNNIIDKIAGAGATASYRGLVPPFDPYFADTPVCKRDLDKAYALLADEGYSEENKLEFRILVREGDTQVADLIKTQLTETGLIDVVIEYKGTTADWQQTYQQGRHMACFGSVTQKGYDMQVGLCTKYLLPFNSSELENNPVCYGNIDLENEDGLTQFGKIYFALKDGLGNEAAYRQAAVDFQNYIVENVPAVCLYLEGNSYAFSSKLSGLIMEDNLGLLNLGTYLNIKKS